MNRKEIAKKCLRMFGRKLPVKWFTDYALEYDRHNTDRPTWLCVQRPNLKITEVENAQREYTANLNLPVSYDLFAILHEIGHLESKQTDYDEYETDLEIVEKLYKMGKLDEKQYIFVYNSLENEKNANDWAINWIKNNENTAKILDSQLN